MAIFCRGNNYLKMNAFRLRKQSGNVFFALFGAVALVGLVGATASGIMSGPMKAMTKVSSRALSENEIMTNMRMAVMGISQPGVTKDCDIDGTVEPLPYKTIAGQTPPVGGGFLPDALAVSSWRDAWGNYYAYCVWDHGPKVDDSTCGGASQNRLPGLNTTTFPAADVGKQTTIAILSAGPDRSFQTRCEDWATADVNADGDVDDAGDKKLVNRPAGSDDLVMSYSYDEASLATSSNWNVASVSVSNPTSCAVPGYTLVNGSCYKLVTSAATWANARLACQGNGADLANLADTADFNAVNILRGTNDVWVGYTDAAVEGTWVWLTSSAYTNWTAGEPNDSGGNEDCGRMDQASGGTLNDQPCGIALYYICEMSGVAGAVADIRSGLVAEYKFDEGTGTTTRDETGAHNGTFVNTPQWVPGRSGGKALSLQDADSDGVQISGKMGSPATATLSAWVNITGIGTANESTIISVGDNIVLRATTAGFFSFFSYAPSTWDWPNSYGAGTLSGAGWKHLVATFDPGTDKFELFLNGSKVGTHWGSTQSISYPGSLNTFIGKHPSNANFNTQGTIDDVRIYNRPLTDGEIAQLYSYYTAGGVTLGVTNAESKLEVGGNTTVAGGVTTTGLKLADQTNSGVCDEANSLALRTNSTSDPAVLEICNWDGVAGAWESISGGGSGDSLSEGLIAHWKFDEGTGTTVADSKGTNTGTFANTPQWSTGKVGSGALNFEATENDGVTVPGLLGKPTEGTISGWVNITGTGGAGTGLVLSIGANVELYTTTTGLVLQYYNGSSWAGGAWYWSVAPGWRHVTGTFNDATDKYVVYVDGQKVDERTNTDPISWNLLNANTRIGGHPAVSNQGFDGTIDDLRVYNRALTEAEVAQLYLTTKGAACQGTGYSSINGRCYKYYNSPVTFASARTTCQADGADLVTLNDTAEFNAMHALRTDNMWVGYSDQAVEGTFVWTDPSSTYSNWDSGEPNNAGNEDCAYMRMTPAGTFADVFCTNTYRYTCEKAPVPSASTTGAELIGHWKMDDVPATTLVDSGPNGYDAIWTGGSGAAQAVKGKIGGAAVLSSNDRQYNLSTALGSKAKTRMSFAGWINPKTWNSYGQTTGFFFQTWPDGFGFMVNKNYESLSFLQYATGAQGMWTASSQGSIKLNEWNHVAVTYDNSLLTNRPTFYINGVVQPSIQELTPSGAIIRTGNYNFGSWSDWNFDGYIDDFRLYDGILSGNEVKAIYLEGQQPTGQASRERYTANQKFAQSVSVKDSAGNASAYGTSVLLQSNRRGAEAGIGLRIDTTQTDTSDATAAVTGVLAGNMGQGALNFKVSDGTNPMTSRMTMDHTGSLGINATPMRPLSSKIQIGDTFTPATGANNNCLTTKEQNLTLKATLATTNAEGIWSDGKFHYVASLGQGLRAYRLNNAGFTLLGTYAGVTGKAVEGDGTYIYVIDSGVGVKAFTFDGATFTLAGSYANIKARDLIVRDGKIIATFENEGIKVLSFNGSAFTVSSSHAGAGATLVGLGGSGSYLYASSSTGLNIFKLDGTALNYVGQYNTFSDVNRIWTDGNYIFAPKYSTGVVAYTFDGAALTQIATHSTGSNVWGMWGDGTSVYVTGDGGLLVYSFNGTAFTLQQTIPSMSWPIWGDGTYIFSGNYTSSLMAYSGRECTALSSFNPAYKRGLLANYYQAGAAAANAFIAVGFSAKLATSPDGVTWTQQDNSAFGAMDLNAIAFGATKLVAIGNGTLVATSSDGVTWTQQNNSAFGAAVMDVIYAGGKFVIVGNSGKLATSPDGITWTLQTSSFGSTSIYGLAHSGSQFVAVGVSGLLATSPDGVTWTQQTSSFGTTTIIAVTYGGGKFVAIGSSGKLATSPDGITWTQQTSSFGTTGIGDVTYGGGKFVAVGNSGKLATSPDGITWTQQTSSFGTTNINGVGYGGGQFVAVGSNGTLATSPDGVTWTQQTSSFGTGFIGDVTYANLSAIPAYSTTGYFGAKGAGISTGASVLYNSSLRFIETAADGTTPVTTALFDTTGNLTLPIPSLYLQRANDNNHFGFYGYSSVATEAGTLKLQRARGTSTLATTIVNGDLIGSLNFSGYNGHASSDITGHGHNALVAKVNGTVAGGSVPTDLLFGYSATGAATTTPLMTLTSAKRLGVNTTAPSAPLHVAGRIQFGNGLRIGMDSTCVDINDAGVLRMNSGALEYCNGAGAWASVVSGGTVTAESTTTDICPYSTGYLRQRGTYTTSNIDGVRGVTIIDQNSLFATAVTADRLSSINIADPDSFTQTSSVAGTDIDGAIRSAYSNGFIYVIGSTSNFTSYSISSANIATLAKLYNATSTYISTPYDIEISGNYAYVSSSANDKISVINITDPYNPLAVASFTHASIDMPQGMAISGTKLYVASNLTDSLTIIDITNPLVPTYVGSVASATAMDGARDVVVSGNYAYVTGNTSDSLAVIDITTPATPTVGASLIDSTNLDTIENLIKVNNHIYATTKTPNAVVSIDVTGPTNPVLVDVLTGATSLDDADSITFSGKYLVVSAPASDSVTMIDIGCDAQPVIDWRAAKLTETTMASPLATGDMYGNWIDISGQYALVGAYGNTSATGRVAVNNVSTGAHERWLTATGGTAGEMFGGVFAVDGNYAVIGAPYANIGSGAAYIFNLQTGTQLFRLRTPGTPGASDSFGFHVSMSGNIAAISSPIKGVFLFDVITGANIATFAPGTPGTDIPLMAVISGNYLGIITVNMSTGIGTAHVYDWPSRQLLYTKAMGALETSGGSGMYATDLKINDSFLVLGMLTPPRMVVYDTATGTQLHTIAPHETMTNDEAYGWKGSLSGKYLLTGAPLYSSDNGAAYLFDISSGNQVAKLSSTPSTDQYGSVALKNNLAIIGAAGDNDGKAYIYNGATTSRQKSDVDCYPQPFDFMDVRSSSVSTSASTKAVKLSGITGNCTLTVASDAGTISMTKNGVAVTGLSTNVITNDKIIITLTTPPNTTTLYKTIVRLGDQTDTFNASVNTGFFVKTTSEYAGNLGGLSGANASCLTELNTRNWLGKSAAGTLTSSRVKAWICDKTTCQNGNASTVYIFAFAGQATIGGATFTTNASGQGPNDSASWNTATTFGSTGYNGTNNNHWTGRPNDANNTLWPLAASATASNNCDGFTTTSGTSRVGDKSFSTYRRWDESGSSCSGTKTLICFVHPQ